MSVALGLLLRNAWDFDQWLSNLLLEATDACVWLMSHFCVDLKKKHTSYCVTTLLSYFFLLLTTIFFTFLWTFLIKLTLYKTDSFALNGLRFSFVNCEFQFVSCDRLLVFSYFQWFVANVLFSFFYFLCQPHCQKHFTNTCVQVCVYISSRCRVSISYGFDDCLSMLFWKNSFHLLFLLRVHVKEVLPESRVGIY